jgi:hypothetical protein
MDEKYDSIINHVKQKRKEQKTHDIPAAQPTPDSMDWKWLAMFSSINNNNNNNHHNKHEWNTILLALLLLLGVIFILLYYLLPSSSSSSCPFTSGNIGFSSNGSSPSPYPAVISATASNPSQQLTYLSASNMMVVTALVGGLSVTRIAVEKQLLYSVQCSLVFMITTSAITNATVTLQPEIIINGTTATTGILYDQISANTDQICYLHVNQTLLLDNNTTVSLLLTCSQTLTVNIISWSVNVSKST